MGFFDSKSESTPSSSTSGAQTQMGDPVSISISGKKVSSKLQVVNNVVNSDYGAIGAALNFADQVSARDSQLALREIDSAERAAGRILSTGDNFARSLVSAGDNFGSNVISAARDVSGQILSQTQAQSVLFSDAVGGLVDGFQEFTNRENNPGERVNLYLIIAAAGVAGVFLLRAK